MLEKTTWTIIWSSSLIFYCWELEGGQTQHKKIAKDYKDVICYDVCLRYIVKLFIRSSMIIRSEVQSFALKLKCSELVVHPCFNPKWLSMGEGCAESIDIIGFCLIHIISFAFILSFQLNIIGSCISGLLRQLPWYSISLQQTMVRLSLFKLRVKHPLICKLHFLVK